MREADYREALLNIAQAYPKRYRGAKYIRNWDRYYKEKLLLVDQMDLTDIESALDIGTGVGMLPYIFMTKKINVEGTDVTEDITGKMFAEACKVINLKRFELFVKPLTPMNLSKHYDLIVSTRTEFDRQEGFDWNYFVDDCFNHCNRIFIRTNLGNSRNPFPKNLQEFTRMIAGGWTLSMDKQVFKS